MQMLEFDDAFDEQVVVPGICNVFELASILEGSGTFDAGEIDQVTNEIQQRLGSETFRIGIKRIAYLISRAKTGSDSNFRALFLDFLIKDLTKSRGGGNIY